MTASAEASTKGTLASHAGAGGKLFAGGLSAPLGSDPASPSVPTSSSAIRPPQPAHATKIAHRRASARRGPRCRCAKAAEPPSLGIGPPGVLRLARRQRYDCPRDSTFDEGGRARGGRRNVVPARTVSALKSWTAFGGSDVPARPGARPDLPSHHAPRGDARDGHARRRAGAPSRARRATAGRADAGAGGVSTRGSPCASSVGRECDPGGVRIPARSRSEHSRHRAGARGGGLGKTRRAAGARRGRHRLASVPGAGARRAECLVLRLRLVRHSPHPRSQPGRRRPGVRHVDASPTRTAPRPREG